MPRPKRTANEPFYTRTTEGERAAINELAKRHAVSIGLSAPDLGVWFRATVRKLAADAGIPIVEPVSASPPSKAPAKRKATTKRGSR